jgi:ketosteroid isomerase-like protein
MVNLEADRIEIEKVLKRIEAAENAHDVDGMLAEMAEPGIIHVCGVPHMEGHAAIRGLYDQFFETFVSTEITQLRVMVASAGDMAWEYGSYVNQYQGPDGPMTEKGKYLGIWTKVAGEWKAAAFSISNSG